MGERQREERPFSRPFKSEDKKGDFCKEACPDFGVCKAFEMGLFFADSARTRV